MYSYEIDNILKSKNYNIDSNMYMNICSASPQIIRIEYEPYGNYFRIWTDDGYYWKFSVYRKE